GRQPSSLGRAHLQVRFNSGARYPSLDSALWGADRARSAQGVRLSSGQFGAAREVSVSGPEHGDGHVGHGQGGDTAEEDLADLVLTAADDHHAGHHQCDHEFAAVLDVVGFPPHHARLDHSEHQDPGDQGGQDAVQHALAHFLFAQSEDGAAEHECPPEEVEDEDDVEDDVHVYDATSEHPVYPRAAGRAAVMVLSSAVPHSAERLSPADAECPWAFPRATSCRSARADPPACGRTRSGAAAYGRPQSSGTARAAAVFKAATMVLVPLMNGTVALAVSGRRSTSAATAATSARGISPRSSARAMCPVPASSVSLLGCRMVHCSLLSRRCSSAAALASA